MAVIIQDEHVVSSVGWDIFSDKGFVKMICFFLFGNGNVWVWSVFTKVSEMKNRGVVQQSLRDFFLDDQRKMGGLIRLNEPR